MGQWFYSSGVAFETPAFQRRGWRARSEHLRNCIVIGPAHRRSLSQGKCWFCSTSGRPWLQRFDSPNRHGLARERARRRTRPNSSDAFIVFFSLAGQRRSSAAAAAPPRQSCVENRETENNPRKGKISTPPPPPAYPPLDVLYLWPKCLGIKSYYLFFFGK